jgi:hypothetical protein
MNPAVPVTDVGAFGVRLDSGAGAMANGLIPLIGTELIEGSVHVRAFKA